MQPAQLPNNKQQEMEVQEVEQQEKTPEPKLTIGRQVVLMGKLLPFMLPLFLVYFGEYLINQGIASVLTFPDSPFDGKEYLYYQLWYVQVLVVVPNVTTNAPVI